MEDKVVVGNLYPQPEGFRNRACMREPQVVATGEDSRAEERHVKRGPRETSGGPGGAREGLGVQGSQPGLGARQ